MTVRWRRRVLLATLAGLAGCGLPSLSGLEPVTVSIVNIRPAEVGLLEQTVDLQLRIVNPNPEPLAVNGLRYTVSLDGGRLGSGASSELFEVPRLGSTLVPVRLYIPTTDIISRFGDLAVRGTSGTGGSIGYRISGDLFVGDRFGGRVPFDGGGEVTLPSTTIRSG